MLLVIPLIIGVTLVTFVVSRSEWSVKEHIDTAGTAAVPRR
jgi:hypothetical protein